MKRGTIFLLSLLIFGVFTNYCYAGNLIKSNDLDNNPSFIIHDTVIGPGELLLQLDALNFVGDNGQVSAITLKIDVDTNLIQFIGIQNTSLVGSWLANYNFTENEISIIYTAFFGNGYDIDGKLLDLHLYYYAGFPASLHFKPGCEVTNVNLQTINNIDYVDGLITQSTPEGVVSQDSIVVNYGDMFTMPVLAAGSGFDSINHVHLRMGYDTNQIHYVGMDESFLTGIDSYDTNGVITFDWQDTVSTVNLTAQDTLFYMNFVFTGDTDVRTMLLPGSRIYNNSELIPVQYMDGVVTARYWQEVLSDPDSAGVTTGAGYYFEGDSVTVSAMANDGFHFNKWVYMDSVVSYDSVYTFGKHPVNDTITAMFKANSYTLTLFTVPADGGSAVGAGDYLYGDSVTVTAVPNEGYDFVGWFFGDDTLSVDTVYTFIMPSNNLGLTAVFQIKTFLITAAVNDSTYGSATGGGVYNYGDSATLIATPFENYNFIAWTENGQAVSYDSVYTFFVDSSRELMANFQYDAVCSAPVGLFVDSLSDSTAMLHWLSSGEESEWDLIWGETGFDTLNGGTLVSGLTEPEYFLTNLNSGTVYDFYVRAVCTDEIHSVWAGPYTFTTWYVSISENLFDKVVIIYPNPVTDILKVTLKEKITKPLSLKITNSFGQIEWIRKREVENSFSIPVHTFRPGVYFLQLTTGSKTSVKVFIKK